MPFAISSESIEHLKDSINIVDVIGRNVSLKKAGANFKGLCPFHNEKTPSFVVSESKQYFTCFGCGARGDVIEYEKRFYNLEFSEAVEKLADEYGIKLEKKGFVELVTDEKDRRKQRIHVTDACRDFLEKNDNNGQQSQYIIGRIFDGVDEASLNATIQTVMKMERNLSAL